MSIHDYLCDNNAEDGPDQPDKTSIESEGPEPMNKTVVNESENEASIKAPEQTAPRCYSNYSENNDLAFDPMKELNLPSSYEEVLTRFNNLQGERAMEALN